MLQKIVKNDIVKREDKTKDVQSKRLRLQKRKSGATPEGEIMAIFMENYKKYCKENGYKQKFVALKTGMSEAKVSRLFKGEQEANEQDMELLSKAFMKFPVFFMQEGFDEKIFTPETSAAEFYLGEAVFQESHPHIPQTRSVYLCTLSFFLPPLPDKTLLRKFPV